MTTPMQSGTATPGVAAATGTGTSGTSQSSSSGGLSPIAALFIELVGVVALSFIADIGPRIGKLITIFMVGILLLWVVTHASVLAKLIPGTNVSVQG